MIQPTNVTKDRKTVQWLLTGVFILWLVFAISSYFVVNKPVLPRLTAQSSSPIVISSATPGALAQALLDLGAAGWITFVALGIGTYVWRWLVNDTGDPTVTLTFATGLGLGVLGLLTLALGLTGFISRPVFVSILALLTFLTGANAIRLLRKLHWKRPPLLIGLYLSLSLGMVLTLALLPPTSWDGLFYHLTGPRLYLQAGKISPGIDIPHLNFPSLFEMLALMGMSLRGDIVAKLLHFVSLLLLSSVVYLMATRLVKVRNGWLSLVFLAGTPLVPVVAPWAYNDLALAFYGLSALYATERWRSSDNSRWLVLAGIFSGLMMGLKYTSIVPAFFLVALIFWHFRRNLKKSIWPLLQFIVPAVVLIGPWLLKNWTFTGNPVYPFLFEGRLWDEFRSAQYSETGTGIGFNLVQLIRLPYDVTLGYTDASQEATIGPFYLIFLPLILVYIFSRLRKQTPPALITFVAYAFTAYLFWTVGVISSAALWQARLFLPGVVVLCPVLAWLMEDMSRFDQPAFSLQRFLRLVIVFVVALLLLFQVRSWLLYNPLAYLSGSETRTEYLERRLGVQYAAMAELNSLIEDNASVVFLWEPRSYYCTVVCHPDSILDRFEHLYFLHGDAQGIVTSWQKENTTHVLIFEAGLKFILEESDDPLTVEEANVLRELREQYLTPVYSWNGIYSLYRIEG